MPVQQKIPKNKNKMAEIGTIGTSAIGGFIQEAYLTELRWPSVWPIYRRLHRADPEVTIARSFYGALASRVNFIPRLPDEPTSDDQAFHDFILEDFENIDGGFSRIVEKLASHGAFLGWGLWEIVAGRRDPEWRPPDRDDWRSHADDGLIGVRRLAWRDHSSLLRWGRDEETSRYLGMWQLDQSGNRSPEFIPFERALHITFGDSDNPEGLSPLESLYRLERYAYGLELVQGIGYEHSAGYVSVETESAATGADEDSVKTAARALFTPQEGNYAIWPKGVTGELIDVPFSAASSLLEAIRFYGLRKLQVLFGMQWIAMNTTTGQGSFAAMQDSSQMSLTIFNSLMEGAARQITNQLIPWYMKVNPDQWTDLSEKPEIVATKVSKEVSLEEAAAFIAVYAEKFEMGEADELAIRNTANGLISEKLPEEDTVIRTPENFGDPEQEFEESEAELVRGRELFVNWAKEHMPAVYRLVNKNDG